VGGPGGRNLAWQIQDGTVKATFLLRDRDSKFTAAFDQVLRSEGVRVLLLPYRAPRANSIAERFVLPARRELLDHLLIFSARHLEAVIKEFLVHYHQARPHQGLEQPAWPLSWRLQCSPAWARRVEVAGTEIQHAPLTT